MPQTSKPFRFARPRNPKSPMFIRSGLCEQADKPAEHDFSEADEAIEAAWRGESPDTVTETPLEPWQEKYRRAKLDRTHSVVGTST